MGGGDGDGVGVWVGLSLAKKLVLDLRVKEVGARAACFQHISTALAAAAADPREGGWEGRANLCVMLLSENPATYGKHRRENVRRSPAMHLGLHQPG